MDTIHDFEDMLELFRQFSGKIRPGIPAKEEVEAWMERYPSGLDPRIVKLREENRDRILGVLIDKMDDGIQVDSRFKFDPGMSREQKYLRSLEWWKDYRFHLKFAVRSPELLNEMLGFSLDPDTMKLLRRAEEKGIPFFVNPYYLTAPTEVWVFRGSVKPGKPVPGRARRSRGRTSGGGPPAGTEPAVPGRTPPSSGKAVSPGPRKTIDVPRFRKPAPVAKMQAAA